MMMTNNEEIEVEAPQNLAFNIDEEMPADGEEDADNIDEIEIANDGLQNNNNTNTKWYGKSNAKVAFLFLAVFAVCVLIGYGSGYGINEQVISNKAAAQSAAVSSSENANVVVQSKTGKFSKSTTSAKASKVAKSSKSSGIGTPSPSLSPSPSWPPSAAPSAAHKYPSASPSEFPSVAPSFDGCTSFDECTCRSLLQRAWDYAVGNRRLC